MVQCRFSGLPLTGYGLRRGRRPRVPCHSPYRKSALRFGAFFWPVWRRELREALMEKGIKKFLPKPGFPDSEKVRIFFSEGVTPPVEDQEPGAGNRACHGEVPAPEAGPPPRSLGEGGRRWPGTAAEKPWRRRKSWYNVHTWGQLLPLGGYCPALCEQAQALTVWLFVGR